MEKEKRKIHRKKPTNLFLEYETHHCPDPSPLVEADVLVGLLVEEADHDGAVQAGVQQVAGLLDQRDCKEKVLSTEEREREQSSTKR